MKLFLIPFFLITLFGGILSVPQSIKAADECSAYSAVGAVTCLPNNTQCDQSFDTKEKFKNANATLKKGTLDTSGAAIVGVCTGSAVCCVKNSTDGAAPTASNFSSTTSNGGTCGSICQWIKSTYKEPTNYDGPIPECAFSGTCRNTNDLVQVLIDQGKMIFGLIGMVALAAFVYGGFLMVFSFGASDKVQQGKDVMVAAVVGIVIVFTAYLAVNFILNALGVSPEFQAIK